MQPRVVDLDRTETWTRWHPSLCSHCDALCCHLPVEASLTDLVRLGLITEFDCGENPALLARRLRKAGLIAHFQHKSMRFTLPQHSSGACCYLDRHSRRCTVYERRPETCRLHPGRGPRPGYCAYVEKVAR